MDVDSVAATKYGCASEDVELMSRLFANRFLVKYWVRVADKRITEACLELVRRAKETSTDASTNATEGTFVKSLLRAKDGTSSGRKNLTDHELIAQIKTFVVAGSETTSSSLTWTLLDVFSRPYLVDHIRSVRTSSCSEYPSKIYSPHQPNHTSLSRDQG